MRRPNVCRRCGESGHNQPTCINNPVPGGLVDKTRSLLGKEPDAVIAVHFGVAPITIRKIREKLGIPKYKKLSVEPQKGVNEKESKDLLRRERFEEKYPGLLERLGQEKDSNISRDFGLSRERVRQIRSSFGIQKSQLWRFEEASELLGKTPDSIIARKFRVSPSTVGRYRRIKGIPTKNKKDYGKILETVKDQIGKVSDRKIAKTLGIPFYQVYLFRNKMGIPPAKLSPRCKGFVPLNRELIREMFEKGISDEEIAKAIGSTRSTVVGMRNKMRLLKRSPNPRIPLEIREEVVRLYKEGGLSKAEIARRVSISPSSVFAILRKIL
jgi:DNA-binding CsgD family transcriptional regulator